MNLKIIPLLFFTALAVEPAQASIIYAGSDWGSYTQALRQVPAGSYTGKNGAGDQCQIEAIEDSSLCNPAVRSPNPGCPSSPSEIEVALTLVAGGYSDFSSPPDTSGGDVDTARILGFSVVHPSPQSTAIHVQVNHHLAEEGYMLETLDLALSTSPTGSSVLTSISMSVGDTESATSTSSPDAVTTTCTGLVMKKGP